MIGRNSRKVRQGVVVRDSIHKTVVVKIEKHDKHPLYHRIVTTSSKMMAHDEQGECKAGDFVEIMETRPLSKRKRWRIVKIVKKAD